MLASMSSSFALHRPRLQSYRSYRPRLQRGCWGIAIVSRSLIGVRVGSFVVVGGVIVSALQTLIFCILVANEDDVLCRNKDDVLCRNEDDVLLGEWRCVFSVTNADLLHPRYKRGRYVV